MRVIPEGNPAGMTTSFQRRDNTIHPTVEVAPFLKITRPRGGEKRISRPISLPGGVLQGRFFLKLFLILPAFWQ